MKLETKQMLYAGFFPVVFILTCCIVFLFEQVSEVNWVRLGICPRRLNGLLGIITGPFIHATLKHLGANSIPILILGWCLFYFYKDLGYIVFPLIWITAGLGTWCIGREYWHVGASGLVYGLSFFLFFSGILRKHIPLMAISMLVVFLYGSIVWNMLPISELADKTVSWEGHLSGAFCGFLWAVLFRNSGHQKPLDSFPEEEDEENGTDDDYWKKGNISAKT